MKLIIGLGNPGEKYQKTRHNLGFMVINELAEKILPLPKTKWRMDRKTNSLLIKINPQLILVRPQTMMNTSGFAVAKLVSFYQVEPSNVWIVHDDVDLPLGRIRIRKGGAAAGHHGVESIINQLGTDQFVRFRLGISHPGRGKDDLVEKYVLEKFRPKEKSEVKKMIKKVIAALKLSFEKGLDVAMNEFNQ
jgi:PTH1 family peptidyl-tRNA hydrolase